MVLPEPLQEKFAEVVEKQEGAKAMNVITPYERRAMEKGERIGIEKGALDATREDTLTALELRFGSVPARIAERVNALTSAATVQKLHRLAITAKTLQEFEQALSHV